MAKNAPLAIAALVLVAGSLVLLFFTILPGLSNTTPLNKTYFLQADTSGITGARDVTQWTYFYFCGEGNTDCGSARPAPAFGKAWDGGARNAPEEIIGKHAGGTTSTHYFYMWRFGWVFFLIALFFEVLTFFGAFLACCGRLGAAISGMLSLVALLFLSAAASLMTAVFVQARNAFQSDDRKATLGRYAFGFVWGAWAALFIATILFCLGLRGDKSARTASTGGGFMSRFKRNRSVRSRRSYDGRRVKDDYS
jgi:hypothetical protein